jgi:hypothetical protein
MQEYRIFQQFHQFEQTATVFQQRPTDVAEVGQFRDVYSETWAELVSFIMCMNIFLFSVVWYCN